MDKHFLEAYKQYADALFRHCYFKVSDRDLAFDLMQEVFKRAWEYVAAGNEVQNMRAFLYRIANNLVVDEYRKKRPVSLEMLAESGLQIAQKERQELGKIIDAKDVLITVEKLAPLYREPVLLRYVQELSVKEIADILGEKENTISVRIHRGLEQLRAILEKTYGQQTS